MDEEWGAPEPDLNPLGHLNRGMAYLTESISQSPGNLQAQQAIAEGVLGLLALKLLQSPQ